MSATTETVVNASDILANTISNSGHLVDKDDTLQYDEKNLCAFDYSSINKLEYKTDPKVYLEKLARENTQLLVSRLFQLQLKSIDEGTLALLPTHPKTPIPRERSLPESKPKTRWEAFAELKGIQKKKKSKMTWDEKHEEYRPTFGYKRANDETEEWAFDAKPDDKVGEDPFQKMIDSKNERVQKQKKREQRNYDEAQMRVQGSVGKPTNFDKEHRGQLKSDLNHSFDVAKMSTASLGKFDKQLTGEKAAPKRGVKKLAGLGDGNVKEESEKNLNLVNKMFRKENVVNLDKAAGQAIQAEQRQNYLNKRSGKDQSNRPNKKQKK
eukprot:gene4044-5062_t